MFLQEVWSLLWTSFSISLLRLDRLLSKHFCLQPFSPKDCGVFYCLLSQWIWISRSQENVFPTHFLTSKRTLSTADKHHFHREYYGLVIKYTKSHHPNWCIKVGNIPLRLPCWWVLLIFFVNRHERVTRSCSV